MCRRLPFIVPPLSTRCPTFVGLYWMSRRSTSIVPQRGANRPKSFGLYVTSIDLECCAERSEPPEIAGTLRMSRRGTSIVAPRDRLGGQGLARWHALIHTQQPISRSRASLSFGRPDEARERLEPDSNVAQSEKKADRISFPGPEKVDVPMKKYSVAPEGSPNQKAQTSDR
jgi:hypothetical protein